MLSASLFDRRFVFKEGRCVLERKRGSLRVKEGKQFSAIGKRKNLLENGFGVDCESMGKENLCALKDTIWAWEITICMFGSELCVDVKGYLCLDGVITSLCGFLSLIWCCVYPTQ